MLKHFTVPFLSTFFLVISGCSTKMGRTDTQKVSAIPRIFNGKPKSITLKRGNNEPLIAAGGRTKTQMTKQEM